MSEFKAIVKATLDTSEIRKQLSELSDIPIALKNITADTNSLAEKIQSALNSKQFRISVIPDSKTALSELSNMQRKFESNIVSGNKRLMTAVERSNLQIQKSNQRTYDKNQRHYEAATHQQIRNAALLTAAQEKANKSYGNKQSTHIPLNLNLDEYYRKAYKDVYGNIGKKAVTETLANGGSLYAGVKNGLYDIQTEKINKVGNAFTDMTDAATRYISLPIVTATALSIKAFTDYETAFTGVRKTVDGTDAELQAISDGLEEMALRVPVASTELAGIAQIGGQLGVPTKNLLGFTEAFAAMETATNLQGQEGAETLARLMNVMNEDYNKIQNVGSAIVDLGNHTATTENEITQMATRMGSSAAIIGISTADVLGYSAALSSLGVRAEMGGSAMTRIWQSIDSAVSEGGESLSAFAKQSKMSAKDFSNAWKTSPTKAFNALLKGLSESEDMIGDLGKIGVSNVRDIQSLEKLAGRYDLVESAIRRANQAYRDGTALQAEADRAYATTASKIQMAKESIIQAAREIGGAVAPTVVNIANGVSGAAKGFAALDKDTQKNIVSTALWTAGGIAAVNMGGKLMKTIGTMRTGLSALSKFMGISAASITPLAVGLAAVGTTALIAKKSYDAWYDSKYNWADGLTEQTAEIEKASSKLVKLNGLKAEVEQLQFTINSSDSSQEEINTAKQRIQEIANLLAEEYNLRINADTSNIDAALDKAKQMTRSDMLNSAKDYIKNLNDTSEKYSSARQQLPELEKEITSLDKISTKYGDLVTSVQLLNREDETYIEDLNAIYQRAKQLGFKNTQGINENIDGMPDAEEFIRRLGAENDRISAELTGKSKEAAEYSEAIKIYNEESDKASDYLAQALASDIKSKDTFGIDTDIDTFTKLGEAMNKAGAETDSIARKFATAKQGLTDFDEAIQSGAAWDIANQFIQFKKSIGETTEESVRGAALIRQGFDTAADVTNGSIDDIQRRTAAIFNDMLFLGKENGLSDDINLSNAIKQTSLLAAGFNNVREATEAGDAGIQSVVENMKSLGEQNNIFGDNADTNSISQQLTKMAHELNLLPDDKTIKINAEGNVEVLSSIADRVKNLEGREIALKFNQTGIETVDSKLTELDGKTFTTILNADEQPALVKIGNAELAVSNYDGNTATAILTAEDGDALYSINFLTGEITALDGTTATTKVETEVEIPEPAPAPQPEAIKYDAEVVTPSIPDIPDKNVTVTATGVDNGVDSLKGTIEDTNSKAVQVTGTGVDNGVSGLKGIIDSIKSKTVTITTITKNVIQTVKETVSSVGSKIKNVFSGGNSGADGTAFSEGTTGSWGAKTSGTALMGELKPELLVRNGKWHLVGTDGAEFHDYRKNDIIFDGNQTEQILKYGKITRGKRRGKAFTNGTVNTGLAFSNGSDDKPEYFDWIERHIKGFERTIKQLKVISDSEYRNFTDRNNALKSQIFTITDEAAAQLQAYERYMEQAESIGLSAEWIEKINNGAFDISSIKDKNLIENINNYQKWIDKANDAYDSLLELAEKQKDLENNLFNNIAEQYSGVLDELEHKSKILDKQLSISEERHLMYSTRYPEKMLGMEEGIYKNLLKKRQALTDALNSSIDSGAISLYSEKWHELQDEITDVSVALLESKENMAKFNNEMRKATWDRFDYMQDNLSNFTNEADFLIDLLEGTELYNTTDSEVRDIISSMQKNSASWHSSSPETKSALEAENKKLASQIEDITKRDTKIDDDGVWWLGNQALYSLNNDNSYGLSDNGMSVMGLHGLKYNVFMEQASSYASEIEKINAQIAKTPYNTTLIERRQELLKLQRESILAANDEKDAMVSLIKDGIEEQVDTLRDLIDAYIDSLDSAKDLYEYQKKIKKHTKDIASLEKQLSAYENDTSEETKAKIQKIKVDLEEARQDLKDTEYDKYISDQKDLLEDLYDEYESLMNEHMEDINISIEKLVSDVNTNASTINKTLTRETSKVGTELSAEMKSVWTSESQALTTYFGDTGIILNGVSGYFENTNTTLSGINTALTTIMNDVNSIVGYASYQARVDIDPEGSKNQMIKNSMDWWATDDSGVRSTLESENEKYGEAFGYTKNDGSWYDSDGNLAYEITNEDNIRNIVSKMKANSEAWHGASDSKRAELSSANENYAKKIQSLTDQPVYKDGNGVWWIGDRELYSYKSGGIADFTGAAWLDGTPSKPELVLNAKDTENFLELKDVLNKMKSQKLSIIGQPENMNTYGVDISPRLRNIPDIRRTLAEFDKPVIQQTNTVNLGGINIDHVQDYNDFVNKIQKDKQFEKLIRSMSVDLLSGGSTLAKNKYNWR